MRRREETEIARPGTIIIAARSSPPHRFKIEVFRSIASEAIASGDATTIAQDSLLKSLEK
jgi:hypothetical protein